MNVRSRGDANDKPQGIQGNCDSLVLPEGCIVKDDAVGSHGKLSRRGCCCRLCGPSSSKCRGWTIVVVVVVVVVDDLTAIGRVGPVPFPFREIEGKWTQKSWAKSLLTTMTMTTTTTQWRLFAGLVWFRRCVAWIVPVAEHIDPWIARKKRWKILWLWGRTMMIPWGRRRQDWMHCCGTKWMRRRTMMSRGSQDASSVSSL